MDIQSDALRRGELEKTETRKRIYITRATGWTVRFRFPAVQDDPLLHNICIDTYFLDLKTNWKWVVNFTPQPLYPQGKSPRYPLDKRLSGPQSQPGRLREEKFLTLPGLDLRPLGRRARSQSLYRLSYPRSHIHITSPKCVVDYSCTICYMAEPVLFCARFWLPVLRSSRRLLLRLHQLSSRYWAVHLPLVPAFRFIWIEKLLVQRRETRSSQLSISAAVNGTIWAQYARKNCTFL
jgi:hypothetical protein